MDTLADKQFRQRANNLVRTAIKQGVLIRPASCSKCGRFHNKVNAAHTDYSRPLDVIWLCPACHMAMDEPLVKRAMKAGRTMRRAKRRLCYGCFHPFDATRHGAQSKSGTAGNRTFCSHRCFAGSMAALGAGAWTH